MLKSLIAFAAAITPAIVVAAIEPPVRVTLATATAETSVRGIATRWTCTGTACVGPASNAAHGDARACREIVREVGEVTAYTSSRGAMDADSLAKCNKAARKPN